MSDALLRLGHAEAVRDFADWYARYLYPSGKVPCCVDRRGADAVPENDSPGEWIHLVREYHRYAHDDGWLRGKSPGVAAAVRYMESLRSREAGPYAGLLAPSISHEGYSDRPAWSYWDDFWGLAGYDAAVAIAQTLGEAQEARRLAAQRDDFSRAVHASIEASMRAHQIDFIPGSADRGDFDATSTTIALDPAGQGAALPRAWLDATFERYWREFVERRDGRRKWDAYTPYEWRAVGSMARLGWRERSQALIDFFLEGRRPAGWNQWAEVVGKDAREPRFVGDMPHAWVGADFARAVLDLFSYERRERESLVLAAGLPPAWLDGGGVAIEGLRTPWGRLGYTLRRTASGVFLRISPRTTMPPGGLVLDWPLGAYARCARLRGARLDGDSVRIDAIPPDGRVELTFKCDP
jgi:hypothetical protein